MHCIRARRVGGEEMVKDQDNLLAHRVVELLMADAQFTYVTLTEILSGTSNRVTGRLSFSVLHTWIENHPDSPAAREKVVVVD